MTRREKYFCGNCGWYFDSPARNKFDIWCPHCGAYDIYFNDKTGAAASVRDIQSYEFETFCCEGGE